MTEKLRPLWLRQDWHSDEQNVDEVTSAGFTYEWGFPPRILAGVTPRALPQMHIDVCVDNQTRSTAKLVVLDYKPAVLFMVPVTPEKLRGKEIELKNFINQKVSAVISKKINATELPFQTYVAKIQFDASAEHGSGKSIVKCFIFRPEDTEGGVISRAISDYAKSKLFVEVALKDVQLLNGIKGEWGRMSFSRVAAARSFLNDMKVDFASYFSVEKSQVHEVQDDKHGPVTLYVKSDDLKVSSIDREKQLCFFSMNFQSRDFWSLVNANNENI